MKLYNLINKLKTFILFLVMMSVAAVYAMALPLDTYAGSSVLAEGRWVKVSVKESGVHFLSRSELQRMGFRDPSKVNVYGYGAVRQPDRLDRTYVDDLPQLQVCRNDRGIYFYAQGPVSYTTVSSTRFRQSHNPYTTSGYYYLSDRESPDREIPITGDPSANGFAANEFNEVVYHERDMYSLGSTGHYLVGEDFRYTTSQTFTFNLTDRVEDEDVWMECSFVANSTSASSISFTANGTALPPVSADNISGNNDSYVHGREVLPTRTFDVSGSKLSVGIAYKPSGTVKAARLNYITVNYIRRLRLNGGKLDFMSDNTVLRISDATAATHVWDVTDPLNIGSMALGEVGDGTLGWANHYTGMRSYVAWNETASFPSPVFVEEVANQNLHGEDVPDMVIFSIPEWISQAERVAELHRNSADSLSVLVVSQESVFNEFSSGSPDAGAFRKMLKMFWDRSDTADRRLRFALFMGRGTFDNRRLTSDIAALNYPVMPIWESERGMSDNDSYTTDDFFAFLRDNSGTNFSSDYMCIAVGRMPVVSLTDARGVVDKLYSYVNNSIQGNWKNRVLIVADDEDSGQHMEQAEKVYANMLGSNGGSRMVYDKIYIDAYDRVGSTYPGARSDMFRILDEGVVWWNYSGHANTTSWTHDGLMTYTDINSLYLRHYPVVYAATCDFQRWDSHETSAAEIMFRSTDGGVIASISATRPVWISENGTMSESMGRYAFALDADGRALTIGEILQNAKNNYGNGASSTNANKLRYVLMGDPAMRLTTPSRQVEVLRINGEEPTEDNQVTIMARQDVTVTGVVRDDNGDVMSDFTGTIRATLYDAEYSTTSHGYGEKGKPVTFEQQGDRLYAGSDSVRCGEFTLRISMPSEITDNFRPAAINLYASAPDGRDAVGVNRNFYVYGYDETAAPDTIAPEIRAMYLNTPHFVSGDVVNESPVVVAEVSDDRAINMSTAGVGHQMVMYLDNKSLTDVHLYYTPSTDGSPSGTIMYPMENISDGNHTLRLRVWDTSGNSMSREVEFFVQRGLIPRIYDLYADANPASVETNFYLVHDRPDAQISVKLTVYNLLGQPVWSTDVSGRSDMLQSFPINWKLTDSAGQRLSRGIYLYRAAISTAGGETSETETRRIAITGQ